MSNLTHTELMHNFGTFFRSSKSLTTDKNGMTHTVWVILRRQHDVVSNYFCDLTDFQYWKLKPWFHTMSLICNYNFQILSVLSRGHWPHSIDWPSMSGQLSDIAWFNVRWLIFLTGDKLDFSLRFNNSFSMWNTYDLFRFLCFV